MAPPVGTRWDRNVHGAVILELIGSKLINPEHNFSNEEIDKIHSEEVEKGSVIGLYDKKKFRPHFKNVLREYMVEKGLQGIRRGESGGE